MYCYISHALAAVSGLVDGSEGLLQQRHVMMQLCSFEIGERGAEVKKGKADLIHFCLSSFSAR